MHTMKILALNSRVSYDFYPVALTKRPNLHDSPLYYYTRSLLTSTHKSARKRGNSVAEFEQVFVSASGRSLNTN